MCLGKKATQQIIYYKMCIYFDNTGSNISMKGDSNIGGKIFVRHWYSTSE